MRDRAGHVSVWAAVTDAVSEGDGRPSETVKALATLTGLLARDVRRLLAERDALVAVDENEAGG